MPVLLAANVVEVPCQTVPFHHWVGAPDGRAMVRLTDCTVPSESNDVPSMT